MNDEQSDTILRAISQENSYDLQLLFSKIFHDIISPVNTISLGVDALQDSFNSSILDCVKESTKNIVSLIEVFRFCTSNRSEECSKIELERILKNIRENIKVVSNNENVKTWVGQLICLLILALNAILAKNETVVCDINYFENKYVFYIKLGKNLSNLPSMEMREASAGNVIWNLALKFSKLKKLSLWTETNEEMTAFLIGAFGK